jgi:hypothetical protein
MTDIISADAPAFVADNGVPLPNISRKSRQPRKLSARAHLVKALANLHVGQSILVTMAVTKPGTDHRKLLSSTANAGRAVNKLPHHGGGFKFACRSQENGDVRIWRTQ